MAESASGRRRRSGRPAHEAGNLVPEAAGRIIDEFLADLRTAIDLIRGKAGGARHPGSTGIGPWRPYRTPLDLACHILVDVLRRCCPELLPPDPMEPGSVTPPIPVPSAGVAPIVGIAARQAVVAATGARVPSSPDQLPGTVLWQDGPDALLVEVGQIAVDVAEGRISVVLPVRCDQLPRGRDLVTVDLVVGTPSRPTGLLAASTEPRGPRGVVRRWGEALTALAWQAVLDATGGVAAAAGADRDGSVLIPAVLTASRSGIAVVAQARHEIDRVRRGEVVHAPYAAKGPRP